MQVDQVLLAGGAGEATKGLLGEHSLFFVIVATLAHEEVVQVLELALEQLEGLLGLGLVGELLGEGGDDVVETVHHGLFELFEFAAVSLAIKLVLDLLDPLSELVAKVFVVSLKVAKTVVDLDNHTFIDISIRR